VTSANVTSANVTSANVTSANVTSANVTSTHVANPDLANVTSANVTSANVTSANVTSANVTSANVTSANVTSAAISDANYVVTNDGNTTHSYHVRIVGSVPAGTPLQLILSKPYTVPLALGCTLYEEPRAQVVSNVGDVSSAVVPPGTNLSDPNIPDPSATNATFALAPGETLQVTLRGAIGTSQMMELTTRLVPAVVPHAGGGYAAPLLVTSDGASLPVPQVGVTYAATLQALGGTPPYTWSLASGSGPLPSGLQLSSTGQLSGIPSAVGSSTFTVQVTDSAPAPGTAPRAITLTVAPGPSGTALSISPSPSSAYEPVILTAAVSPASAGMPTPTGEVTFLDGHSALGTVALQDGSASLTVASFGVGGHSLSASYGGNGSYLASGSPATTLQVNTGAVAVTLLAAPSLPVHGQPVSLTATVARDPGYVGAPMPTGTVTFFDGAEPLGQVLLSGGQATFQATDLGVGGHVFVARYGGDTTSAPGISVGQPLVVDRASTSTSLSSSLQPSFAGQAVTFRATVAIVAPGTGTSTGAVTFFDGATALGTEVVVAGQASLTTSTLATGAHAITARYGGDATNQPSISSGLIQDVVLDPVKVTLQAIPGLPVFGQPVSLTATAVRDPAWPGAPALTGTVTFFDGPEPIGQAVLSGGIASLQVNGLATGGHVFVASYGGDATSATGTSTGQPLVVNLATTSTTLASSLNPSSSGQAVTFSAAVSVVAPGAGAVAGTVTFLDGATVLGFGTVTGGAASLTTSALAVGTHAITARYDGGGGLASSTSPPLSQVVKNTFYAFTGFLSPLSTAGTLASPSISPTQNYGSGVPIKWQLKDASGAVVSRLSSTTLLKAVLNTACSGPAPAGAPEVMLYSPTSGAAGGSTFRFSTDQFVFNWDTSKGATKGCWEIVLVLDDGSPPKATIVKLK
jgi:hypothetical protein